MAQAKAAIVELRQKRAALIEESRKLIDAAAATETKRMTADQETRYKKIMDDVDGLKATIDAEERQTALEAEMAQAAEQPDLRGKGADQEKATEAAEKKLRSDFVKYFRTGVATPELRALSAGSDVDGGYIMTPQTLARDILKAADASLKLRTLINVIPIDRAESLGIPTLDTDVSDADWTTEIATGTEDSSMKFGKRELKPNPLAKLLKASNKFLRNSYVNADAFIVERLGYKVATVLEKAYMIGTGTSQPLGLFVASANGIPTTRDKDIGAYTALTGDHLIEMQHAIREPYRPNAAWVLHTDWLARIRKLKDAVTGGYLWQPGLLLNQPDTLLGKRVVESEFCPNGTSSGSYAIIYGELKYYHAVDSLAIFVQRLQELYAATDQTGYIIRYEGDGQPVMAEAFSRAKVSA